ncbi:hypothetical protein CF328_g648 [Tilletia controversa]|nr:hypothetical protein CF328_g648 [Tilletia controversa]
MGLLSAGTPLDWDDTRVLADHVRKHGITQFLNLYQRIKTRRGDSFLWGDEIEYIVCSLDHPNRNAKLSLRQEEILAVLDKAAGANAELPKPVRADLELDQPEAAAMSSAAETIPFERNPAQPPPPSASASSAKPAASLVADDDDIPTFHPEYGRYMLESTPGRPYGVSLRQLIRVEANMRKRRQIARFHLRPDEIPITLTSFPRLGVTDGPFTEPEFEANGNASRSLFLPDQLINTHPRFPTLTANIRKRRGAKVAINMPIFVDKNTPQPFIDPSIPWDRNLFPKEDAEAKNGAAKENHIYMDAMGFGMGCCCLQVTFQACSIEEARSIYDALVPVGPLMLALTAASPAYRGYLADVDCRWNVISAAVDDRTPAERGLASLPTAEERAQYEAAHGGGGGGGCRMRMRKSRYDSVDSYLGKSTDPAFRQEYNDNPLEVDEEIKARLMRPLSEGGGGLDASLASHLAHLFIRDPLVIFSERIDQDDESSTDHFENIQSTNWQTMRFKPPPPDGTIGWRVEFRSMEVQVTDFENAAFSIFIVLLTRAIQSFGLNFYMPISKVDVNMQRAHVRDAIHTRKFFFRRQVFRGRSRHSTATASPKEGPSDGLAPGSSSSPADLDEGGASGSALPVDDEIAEYTIDELMNGKKSSNSNTKKRKGSTAGLEGGAAEDDDDDEQDDEEDDDDSFPGLLVLVTNYVDSLNVDLSTRAEIGRYLDLLSARANGSLITTATWIRDYVRSHPEYKFDSVVSQGINYDMILELDKIERGEVEAPTFLPGLYAKRRRDAEARSQVGKSPQPSTGHGMDTIEVLTISDVSSERSATPTEEPVAIEPEAAKAPAIRFGSDTEPFFFLSNSFPSRITFHDHEFANAEAIFQAAKFHERKGLQLAIAKTKSPEDVLNKAQTGDAELTYTTDADDYFGCNGGGQGQNHLGKILMGVRGFLRTVPEPTQLPKCFKRASPDPSCSTVWSTNLASEQWYPPAPGETVLTDVIIEPAIEDAPASGDAFLHSIAHGKEPWSLEVLIQVRGVAASRNKGPWLHVAPDMTKGGPWVPIETRVQLSSKHLKATTKGGADVCIYRVRVGLPRHDKKMGIYIWPYNSSQGSHPNHTLIVKTAAAE